MDDIDVERAAWFRATLRFVDHGLTERKAAWSSWEQWCADHNNDVGSKTKHHRWLLMIGARPFGRFYRRIKLQG